MCQVISSLRKPCHDIVATIVGVKEIKFNSSEYIVLSGAMNWPQNPLTLGMKLKERISCILLFLSSANTMAGNSE